MLNKLLRAIGLVQRSRFEAMRDLHQQEVRYTAQFVERLLIQADCEEVRRAIRTHTAFRFYVFNAPPIFKLVDADDHGEQAVDQAKRLTDAVSVLAGKAAEITVAARRLTTALAEAKSEHRKLLHAMEEKPERRFATGGLVSPKFKAVVTRKKHNEIGHVDDETGRACITVRDYHESDVLVDRPFYRYRENDMTGDPWVLYDSADKHVHGDVYDIWRHGSALAVQGGYPVYIQKEDYERMTRAPEDKA